MKHIENFVGKDVFFGLIVAVTAAVVLLGGCATKDPAKPVPAADQPISAHEAAASSINSCTAAIQAIAVSAAGDAASKVAAVGSIERICGQNGAQAAFRMAPTPEPPSLGATLWQAGLQVADLFLRGYGIKSTRDVSINASDNSARTAIASYGAFQGMNAASVGANVDIARLIQAPAANNTAILSGTGVLGSGSYIGPVTRNCVGGSGQAGAGGTGTATIPATPGAPAAGGPASC